MALPAIKRVKTPKQNAESRLLKDLRSKPIIAKRYLKKLIVNAMLQHAVDEILQ